MNLEIVLLLSCTKAMEVHVMIGGWMMGWEWLMAEWGYAD